MTIGNQTVGVQVGNETYSLVVTDEDLEKRRIERERQKRLSQETNRRRKALEDRKKLAEEREARKRSLELSKRKQRQTEATEKYQRSHIGSRHDKRNKFATGLKGIPSLDHVLQQLRSGSTEIVYQNKSDTNSVASAMELTNHGRAQFESELQEQQRQVLQQHKHDTMQEFQQELRSDVMPSPSGVIADDVSDTDSLDENQPAPQNEFVSQSFYPAYARYPAHASNVDLMSGRTYGQHFTVDEDHHAPANQHWSQNTSGANQLADSLSRLFVNQNQQGMSANEHFSNARERQQASVLPESEPSEQHRDQLQFQKTPNSVQRGVTIPQRSTNQKLGNEASKTWWNQQDNLPNQEVAQDADQDSLHGSSGSGNSPVYSHMTSFQRRYFDDLTSTDQHNTAAPTQVSKVPGSSPADASGPESSEKHRVSGPRVDDEARVLNRQPGPNEPSIYAGYSSKEQQQQQDVPRAPPNYYIKSYRPWSASEKTRQSPFEDSPKTPTKRPFSAAVSTPLRQQNESRIPEPPTLGAQKQPPVKSDPGPMDSGLLDQLQSTNNKWVSFTKTNATPISSDYAGEPRIRPPEKTTVVVAAQPPATSSTGDVTPTKTPSPFANAHPLPVPTAHAKVTFTPDTLKDEKEDQEVEVKFGSGGETKTYKDIKGILRKTSKYGGKARRPPLGYSPSHPSYQSAAVARQQWVNHITGSPYLKAKLSGTEVRDSMEVTRGDAEEQEEGRQSPGKSVRWHEVQYNDGTSATISTSGIVAKTPIPVATSIPVATVKQASPRGGKARPKSAPASRSKPQKPPASPKGGKKSSSKGVRGRKLKPARDADVAMEPHPPPAPRKKQLTVSTTINYSIPNFSSQKREDHQRSGSHHRVAWAAEEAVTMDTLKSSGSPEPPRSHSDEEKRPVNGTVLHKAGNQVTFAIISPEKPMSRDHRGQSEADTSISLTKTPTDEEINWLWTKVRTCLAQRPATRSHSTGVRKSASDTRFAPAPGNNRRSAWGSTQASNHPQQQQQASIVSIDGGLLSRDNMMTSQHPHVVARSRGRRLIRPNSAVQLSSKQSTADTYGAFMRRQALMQQRRHKQFMTRSSRPDQMKGVINYPSPKPSPGGPLNSPSSGAGGGVGERVNDSTTAFLLAETLAEQNMSEEQIISAMDSLQRRTKDAQNAGKPVMPSTLSMEEQHLLASLERLNSRLREVESAVSTNNFFNTHTGYAMDRDRQSHRQRSVSADVRYQRSRPRY